MATIAPLVAKMGWNDGEFVTGVARTVQRTAELAQKVVQANAGVRALTATHQAASKALNDADQKAGGYLKTLLKLGSATAIVTAGIKAAHQSDKAKSALNDAQGGGPLANNVADSYERVQHAVTLAYEAFGTAFAKSAGLANILDQLTNIVVNLTPAFEFVGRAVGVVVSYLTSSTPLAFALLGALKLLAAAMSLLAAAVPIVAFSALVYWLTGAVPLVWALRAAIWAIPIALNAVSAALGLLEAIGLPLWGALAAAVAVVAGVVYALYRAWQWLTRPSESVGKTAAEMDKLAKETTKATEEADKLREALDTDRMNAGLTSAEAKMKQLADAMRKAGKNDTAIEREMDLQRTAEATASRFTAFKKAQADVEKLNKELLLSGQTDQQKMLAGFKDAGINQGALDALQRNMELGKQLEKQAELRRDTEKQIADLQFEADTVGLTAAQKRVEMLKQEHATAEAIAQAQQAADTIDAFQKRKDIAEQVAKLEKETSDLQFEADTLGLNPAQKKLELLKQQHATAERLAKAQKAADKYTATANRMKDLEKVKQLTDSALTPLQKYNDQLATIFRAKAAGDLQGQALDAALAAAKKGYLGNDGSYKYESPTALFKGSADAELAADRDKIGRSVEEQRRAHAEKLARQAEQQANERNVALIGAVKENKPQPEMVVDNF